ACLVFHEQKVVLDRPHGEPLEALVDADAVVGVDDEVALVELAEGLQEVALAGPGGPASARLLPEDLLLAHDDKARPGQGEAPGDLPLAENKASLGAPRRAELLEEGLLRVCHGQRVVLQ